MEPILPRTISRPVAILAMLVALACSALLFSRPPAAEAATYKSYSTYVGQFRPVMHQWWEGIEAWQGHHFMLEPTAANMENAAEVNTLLRQWWFGLENKRGNHFLIEPVGSNTDSTSELYSVVGQWQNGVEAWRGFHFMLEPPYPFISLPTKTVGTFSLSPRRSTVDVGERFTYAIRWVVPEPYNWHDLDWIDLRLCGKGGPLWVRWSELDNTLTLRNPRTGKPTAEGRLGKTRRVANSAAILFPRASAAKGNGDTGRRVVLKLEMKLRGAFAGRNCRVDLAAQDDFGNRDTFEPAGRLRITGR